jgi:DNA-binding NarL/FixJ family response regulator
MRADIGAFDLILLAALVGYDNDLDTSRPLLLRIGNDAKSVRPGFCVRQPELWLNSALPSAGRLCCCRRHTPPARPDVPIIMITAYGDAETKRRALEGGAEAPLTKPIDFVMLRSEIDTRVERTA